MTLTKIQTDDDILSTVQAEDKVTEDLITEIDIRHTSSAHPIDCKCKVCIEKRFDNSKNENGIKEELNYFIGDSNE